MKFQQTFRNFFRFANFFKIQLYNLVDLKKCWKTRIYLQRSVPIQPKTKESLPKIPWYALLRRTPRRTSLGVHHAATLAGAAAWYALGAFSLIQGKCSPGVRVSKIGKISQICKFLAGSFSAVSKRNFARKYSFDNIFQALQDLHTFAQLQSQIFRKKSFWKINNFRENSAKSRKLQNLVKFQEFQFDNLVDFEKCCKTRICLQRSVPIQPKTSEILPKIGNYPTGPLPYGPVGRSLRAGGGAP